MKKSMILLSLLLACSLIFALGLPQLRDENLYFGGNLAIVAKGDTVAYVYLKEFESARQRIILRFSFDAGNTWQEVSQYVYSQVFNPTSQIVDDGIWIAGPQLRVFYSFQDQFFEPEYFHNILSDSTPYHYVSGDDRYYFSSIKPYPESLQYELSYGGFESPLLKPIHYFLDEATTIHGHMAAFTGMNVMEGVFATNSSFLIKQAGGGDNNGWPLFESPVLCGSNVASIPPVYPADSVFPAGLHENTPKIRIPYTFNREDFDVVLGGEDKIILIEMNGDSFSGWEGSLSAPYYVAKALYSSYPPGEDPYYTNYYTIRDTLWTPIESFNPTDKHILVNGKLWIKGDFKGVQNWYCDGDIKLIGEITLSHSTPGQYPTATPLDVVNLIARGDVIVGYGYKHPATNIRQHCFVAPDSQPMYIYANIYALGGPLPQMFEGMKSLGVFTFEYQHPHPSTPAIALEIDDETVIFDNIDIHRYYYPPTANHPWPSPNLGQQRLDLPYYNPLWPEANPYLERGTLHIYGNVYQRCKGFFHRSHNDAEYPSNSGIWDIDLDRCGYSTEPIIIEDPIFGTQILLQSQNYPGAVGSGVGYKTQYFADQRYAELLLPDETYSQIMRSGLRISKAPFIEYNNQGEMLAFTPDNSITQSKCVSQRDGAFVFASNDAMLYLADGDVAKDLGALVKGEGTILNAEIDPDGIIWLLQSKSENYHRNLHLRRIDPIAESLLSSQIFPANYIHKPAALHISESGRKFLGFYEDGFLNIWELFNFHAPQIIVNIDVSSYITDYSKLSMQECSGKLQILFWENTSQDPVLGTGNLHYYNLDLPVSNAENTIPALVQSSLNTYPNPFHNELYINIKTDKAVSGKIQIYNLRGQLVREIPADFTKGDNQLLWNAKAQDGRKLPAGIYFCRLQIGHQVKSKKILLLK